MLQSIIMPIENFLSLIQNLWFQPLLLISTHSLTCPVTIMLLKYPLHALVTVTSLNYSDHPLTSSMRLNCNHDQHIIELQDSLSSCMMIKCPLSDRTLNCARHMACDLACAGSSDEPHDEPLVPNDVSRHHTLNLIHQSYTLDPNDTLTGSIWLDDSITT